MLNCFNKITGNMKNILLPKDYEYLGELVEEINDETKKLAKKLGDAASHGGSFQIPEYQAIEDRLRVINERKNNVQRVLVGSKVIPFEKIDNKIIGLYCLIETENKNIGSKEIFYIIYPEIADNIRFEDNILPVSPSSPVGQALTGKKAGNVVEIKLPKDTKTLEVISFEKKEY